MTLNKKHINWGYVLFGEKEERKKKFGRALKSNLIELLIALLLFALFFGTRWAAAKGLFNKETLESQLSVTSEEPSGSASVFENKVDSVEDIDFNQIPNDILFIEVNGNVPFFVTDSTDSFKISTEPYESYSHLDDLGRCGIAKANICTEVMPEKDEQRSDDLSSVTPSGYQVIRDNNIENGYLYNRSHLIGFQLAGENANEQNLITGTRQFNVDGMQPFENKVAYYIYDNPDNHVMYRVTPVFQGNELVARGVLIEAYSVEDEGKGISFCVFIPNLQKDYKINYVTGEAELV